LLIEYEGFTLGRIHLEPFTVLHDTVSHQPVSGSIFKPSTNGTAEEAALYRMLSKFISRQDTEITLKADMNDITRIPSLDQAFSTIHQNLQLPILQDSLLRHSTCHFLFSTVTMTFFNPFQTPVLLRNLTAISYKENVTVGVIEGDVNLVLKANEETQSQRLPFKFMEGGSTIIREAMGGIVLLDVDVNVQFFVGNFSVVGNWLESNVTVNVSWW